ncbi:MAG: AMP-binding protein [Verrucomicrobiae bacterium]|nr:AMP-binding protein [Verrucomicrobiae bacterium]
MEATEQSIHDRFEHQVALYPNRVAIRTRKNALTYRQLNEFSNRIANQLLDRLKDSAEPVAILFPQGIHAVASILGILKAGKCYVPLDPSQSKQHVLTMLEGSEATLVVTDHRNRELAEVLGTQVLNIECIDDASPEDNPGIAVRPDDLAYIYFTSGSTGVPKGVMDNHRNVLHNVMRYTNTLKISPQDCLSLIQACVFSGTVSSMFGALCNGASVLAIDLPLETSASLAEFLIEENVTIYHSVPAIFRSFLQGDLTFPGVRTVRLEGDQASGRDVRLFKKHFREDCVLVNGLGSTETGLVSQYFVNQKASTPQGGLPIGFPVSDMEIQLLDEAGEAVAENTIGEIAVRSKYLAVGYWRQSEKSSQSFVKDFKDPDYRIYFTGDLGRRREDGCLEYLGRKDSRTKVRGQVVDVTEVESALLELDAIEEAVVRTIEDAAGTRLVAFLVAENLAIPPVPQLRNHLSKLLPDHMIPAKFVSLENMPLTESGKIDRRQLSTLPSTRPNLVVPFVPPATEVQKQIQTIWEGLLALSKIGIKDDFVELGGDSLLAISMIDQVERELSVKIPISVLSSKISIESLSEVISGKKVQHFIPFIDIPRKAENPPFYYLHGNYMDGGWNCQQFAPYLKQDRAIVAMPPSGSDGQPVLESYQKMAAHHVEKLTAYHRGGPYLIGGHCNGGLVALEIARLLKEQDKTIGLLVIIAATVSNLRFKRMRHFFHGMDKLGGKDFGLWTRFFLLLRRGILRMDTHSGMEKIRYLMRIFPKISGYLKADRMAPLIGSAKRNSLSNPANPTGSSELARKVIRAQYQQIDNLYIPEPYDGPITVLWPEGESETATAGEKYWRKVSDDLRFRVIPGDHITSRNRHPESYGKALQACLDLVT